MATVMRLFKQCRDYTKLYAFTGIHRKDTIFILSFMHGSKVCYNILTLTCFID